MEVLPEPDDKDDKDIVICILPGGFLPAVLIRRGMLRKAQEELAPKDKENDDDIPPKPRSGHRARSGGRIALGHGF